MNLLQRRTTRCDRKQNSLRHPSCPNGRARLASGCIRAILRYVWWFCTLSPGCTCRRYAWNPEPLTSNGFRTTDPLSGVPDFSLRQFRQPFDVPFCDSVVLFFRPDHCKLLTFPKDEILTLMLGFVMDSHDATDQKFVLPVLSSRAGKG